MRLFSSICILLQCVFFSLICVHDCYAKQYARSLGADSHIKVLTYNPFSVHVHVGFPGVVCSIVLEKGEQITSLAMGDSTGWNILPDGNTLVVRPVMDPSEKIDTNALLITNKRVYLYEFVAKAFSNLDDPEVAYREVFMYPGGKAQQDLGSTGESGDGSGIVPMSPLDVDMSDLPDISDSSVAARGLNFRYTFSRAVDSEVIVPTRVFDDGHFTYIEFSQKMRSLPAAFEVDPNGYESLVNVRSRAGGRIMIVEKVVKVMTLRDGAMTVCLFNNGVDW